MTSGNSNGILNFLQLNKSLFMLFINCNGQQMNLKVQGRTLLNSMFIDTWQYLEAFGNLICF